jgi:hypothetical protein
VPSAAELPSSSSLCRVGAHPDCGHTAGSGAKLFGKDRGSYVLLCHCGCHEHCPLAGQERSSEAAWEQQCSCPGSDRRRALRAAATTIGSEHADAVKAALAEVEVGHGRSAAELETEIGAALRRRGITQSAGMTRTMAEAMSAATGRRALAAPRLGLLGARLLVRGVRTLWRHRV